MGTGLDKSRHPSAAAMTDLSRGGAPGRRVLLVDDHDGFRSAARALLVSEGFRVVGEAADGVSGVAAADRLAPDVVLLDVGLPDIDGFEVARRLAAGSRPTPVVVLVSARIAASYRRRLIGSPVRGLLSKADLTGPALMALLGPDAAGGEGGAGA